MLMIINAGESEVAFQLPPEGRNDTLTTWRVLITTDDPRGNSPAAHLEHTTIAVPARTVLLCDGVDTEAPVD